MPLMVLMVVTMLVTDAHWHPRYLIGARPIRGGTHRDGTLDEVHQSGPECAMSTSSVFGSSDQLAAELVRLTIEAATSSIAARGRFTMALTGGSAATMTYPVLAQAPLPWENVHIFYGDERCVPPTQIGRAHV